MAIAIRFSNKGINSLVSLMRFSTSHKFNSHNGKTHDEPMEKKSTYVDLNKELRAFYLLGMNTASALDGHLPMLSRSEKEVVVKGMSEYIMGTSKSFDISIDDSFHLRQIMSEKKTRTRTFDDSVLSVAKMEAGSIQTRSGLVFVSVKEGTGPCPGEQSTVRVHYEGLTLDGKIFDSTYTRNEPLVLRVDEAIPGLKEGLCMIKLGGKAKLTIPSLLAYGNGGNGKPAGVLIFNVELLEIF